MRFTTILLATTISSAQAFSSPAFTTIRPTTTFLQGTHIDKSFTADSGMNVESLPLYINNLNADNFEESLEIFEAILSNECVGETCEDYVGQLADKAKTIGKELPKGFGTKHH